MRNRPQRAEMQLSLAQFDRRCDRLPVGLASVSVVPERLVRVGFVGRKLALVLLSAASLTFACIRVGMSPATSVMVSAVLIGVMSSRATVLPNAFRRDASLWSFQANKQAVDLLGVSVPSRRYGLRRTSMPYFRVRLGANASTLYVVDVDGRRTDLSTTGCRFELCCTRTSVTAQGRLSARARHETSPPGASRRGTELL